MAFYPSSLAPSAPRLLLPVMLTLVGTTSTLHADSPFLRGSAGANPAASAATQASTDGADPDEPAVLALGPRTVRVAAGANAILEVAIDHLNRIVTPFERPSVRTVSDLSTEVEGKVVYVATASEVPATLYISAGDALDRLYLPKLAHFSPLGGVVADFFVERFFQNVAMHMKY